MDRDLAHAIADGYERWADTGDQSVMRLLSPNFYDNVSGQSGLAIFDVVAGWLEQSFTERRVQHHATMSDDDRVMVWFTQHGRHIGNGFPRLRECAVGAQVACVSGGPTSFIATAAGRITILVTGAGGRPRQATAWPSGT